MNFLQFACNVPIETDGMSCSTRMSAIFVLRASAQIEALPRALHAYSGEKRREYTENGLVAGTIGLASHLHCWISKHSFGVVLVIRGKVG